MSNRTACLAFVILATIVGCKAIHSSNKELLHVWSAQGISARERASAVNHYFTNGTPITQIVAVLGTNYSQLHPFSTIWIGEGPAPRKTSGLIYSFERESVVIQTTADVGHDPLTGLFAGAGSQIPVKLSISQPGGPANGSQPFRSETNSTPSAAGSRR